jgi:hypothetical protein
MMNFKLFRAQFANTITVLVDVRLVMIELRYILAFLVTVKRYTAQKGGSRQHEVTHHDPTNT